MKINNVAMAILVKGRPITEYSHQDQTFVEGRAGSNYEIELCNHSFHRVEVVLSVDGLSVIDGKPAGEQSRGYLIDPYSTIRIPGWTLDAQSAAKFAFAGMQQSYTAESGGDTRNNGVIGAMVFREKLKPVLHHWATMQSTTPAYSGILSNASLTNRGYDIETKTSGSTVSGRGIFDSAPRGLTATASVENVNFVEQGLGTGFGQATEFATKTVPFERAELLATLLCFYDEKKGLKQRGIKMERRPRRKPAQPQAFPAAAGCQPPLGWKG